ncbi:MAG TPA: fructosamine kinase family protein [Burkholderiales bacterium]|nr:fructosamine kinase family protein [Burkholderiales bacterium]
MVAAPDAATWQAIAADLTRTTGSRFSVSRAEPTGGGSINRAFRLDGDGQRFFVKLNVAGRLGMFEAELAGLLELRAAKAVRVPAPICCGSDTLFSWIVLEHLELGNGAPGLAALGAQLALLHRRSAANFGWDRDNTIGSTPQHNEWCNDWIVFLRERRIGFQLQLAQRNRYGGRLQSSGEKLRAGLDAFFTGYRPEASLLHGDLWGGNAAVLADGEPVIFDPAVYYGDREADLAMTELFGGFPQAFYRGYDNAWPLDPGYRVRKQLYNLYHLLNHLNLFGGSYLAPAQATIDGLLGEIRS